MSTPGGKESAHSHGAKHDQVPEAAGAVQHAVRAVRPFDAHDGALFAAVSRGEFTLKGFRNRDLQRLLFPTRPQPTLRGADARPGSAQMRLLRADGLIRKIPGTHRYHVTPFGRKAITALLTALRSTVRQLTPVAA